MTAGDDVPAWRRRAGTAAFIAVASLVLAELALRLLSLIPGDSRFFVSDTDVGFRFRPHHAIQGRSTNAHGFNDTENEIKRGTGHRIAFVGDSFVFGTVPRDENFVTAFKNLADGDGRDVEVFNMGIPGSGPENYLGLMEHDVTAVAATDVVVVFFVGNDIEQSHPDFKTRVWFGVPRAMLRKPYLLKLSPDYFYTWKLLRGAARLLRNRLDRPEGELFAGRSVLAIEHRRLAVFRQREEAMVAAGYRGAEDALARIAGAARRRGARLTVVLAPDQVQVDPEVRAELRRLFGVDWDDYDLDKPQRRLGAALAGLGIPAVDLLDAFREDGGGLYQERDTHWNARGNRLAAELIYGAWSAEAKKTETDDADPT